MRCPPLSSSSLLEVRAGGWKKGLLGEFEKGSETKESEAKVSEGGGRKKEESLGAPGGLKLN